MMSKFSVRIFLLIPFLLGTFSVAFSQEGPKIKVIEGQRFIAYKIQKGDTWFALSNEYNTSVKNLQKVNSKVKELKFDQIIFIPYDLYSNSKKSEAVNKKSEVRNKENDAVELITNEDGSSNDSLKNNSHSFTIRKSNSSKSNVTSSSQKSTLPKDVSAQSSNQILLHKVVAGETLFRIAIKNHTTVKYLAEFNNLKSTDVKIGQVLKIPQSVKHENKDNSPNSNVASNEPETTIVKSNRSKSNDSLVTTNSEVLSADSDISEPNISSAWIGGNYERFYFNNTTEHGVATWMMEFSSAKKEKFYALHRSASVGTIIKVVNPMNKRSVFVKVVGQLPDTGDNHDVLIKITQAAARKIGIFESRFRVDISYGVKLNESSKN